MIVVTQMTEFPKRCADCQLFGDVGDCVALQRYVYPLQREEDCPLILRGEAVMSNKIKPVVHIELIGVERIQENCKKISALIDEIKALIKEINETEINVTLSEADRRPLQ